MGEKYDILEKGPKVSMIVADCKLNSLIDIAVVFSTLKTPVFPFTFKKKGLNLDKLKLKPGTILSTSYNGITRGILKNKKKTYFKHSASVDISCISGNVNTKISPDGIHLCGITSEGMIDEVMRYLISHIKEIQLYLSYANNNQEERDKTIAWLKETTKSIGIKRYSKSIRKLGKKDIKIISYTYDYFIRPISRNDLENAPNEKIANFYLRMSNDLVYHSDFCTLLDWIKNIQWVCNMNLGVRETLIRVKNSNSKLISNIGTCIDFAIKFVEMFPDYRIFYDNAIKPSTLTINIPYHHPDDHIDSEDRVHTFMLQKSGAFSHSGPGGEESKIGYNKFIAAMGKILPLIEHY